MNIDELEEHNIDYISRLACLMYGVNVAAEAADRRGLCVETGSVWLKPIVFQKYINERYEDMRFNIKKSLRGCDDEIYSW